MTIDESLEWLVARKEHYEMDDNCQELAKALDVAIDTMRKYQKIERLYYAWIATWPPKNAEEFLIKIGEVIVDKNDNLDIKQFERY